MYKMPSEFDSVTVPGRAAESGVFAATDALTPPVTWTTIETVPLTGSMVQFLDEPTAGQHPRFYRLGITPPPQMPVKWDSDPR